MIASAMTDVGKVRLENQDSFRTGEFPGGVFAVVCDGMGGAAGGSVASSVTAAVFAEEVELACKNGLPDGEAGDVMISAAAKANADVYKKSVSDPALSGMGTTLVAAMIVGEKLYIAHAGDSRAYLSTAQGLKLLTKDHSVVQSLLDSGYITPEQAEHHVYKNLITRALVFFFNDTATTEIYTIAWDGIRAAFDDIRYATLLKRTATEFLSSKDEGLRREARRQLIWLEQRDGYNADMRMLRLAMIDRVVTLMELRDKVARETAAAAQ